jgi:hypothetical protein
MVFTLKLKDLHNSATDSMKNKPSTQRKIQVAGLPVNDMSESHGAIS